MNIKLTKDKVALIDEDMYDVLSKYKWQYNQGYASTSMNFNNGKFRNVYMHWFIIGKPIEGYITDHINRNKLDNRKENLRIVSQQINAINSVNTKNTSGYRGIVWHKRDKKWQAQIYLTTNSKQKTIYLGLFDSKEEAALEYNKGAVKYHGQYAQLNEVKQ